MCVCKRNTALPLNNQQSSARLSLGGVMATEQLQLEEKKAFPLGMALEREPSVNERGKGGSVYVCV